MKILLWNSGVMAVLGPSWLVLVNQTDSVTRQGVGPNRGCFLDGIQSPSITP